MSYAKDLSYCVLRIAYLALHAENTQYGIRNTEHAIRNPHPEAPHV
jgi:hypothetical protein